MSFEQAPNLLSLLLDSVGRLGDRPFLWSKRDGNYSPQSWIEVRDEISNIYRGLKAIGIEPGDRVALVAENQPKWLIADCAIMACGAITVPAYTTNTVEDHLHILNNSGAKAVFVSDRKLARALLPAAHTAQSVDSVISMEPLELHQDIGPTVFGWDEIKAKGAAQPDDLSDAVGRIERTDTCCIIHTSGTGGSPKGVMLSHGAVISNCDGAFNIFKKHVAIDSEVFLCFLPLSHAYEHTAGQFLPICIGAQIYYAEGVESLVANMAEARPTIMTAVPRLYETILQRIRTQLKRSGGVKERLFERAVILGSKRYENADGLTLLERIVDNILDLLVRKKVRERFGGRLKFFVSGGAPLNYEVGRFFTALGVRLLQGYGQTEAAPIVSCNPVEKLKLHTVGPPLTGVEVRTADDGEILIRGELVMQGYWNDPESTAATIRDDWLHTGDVGRIDEDGYIQVTDRKKDLIVNSGGDNVSPQRVEGFLTLQPEISQAMVYGDRRPYLVALIVPESEIVESWSKANGMPADLAVLADDPGFRDVVAAAIDRVNGEMSSIEKVRRFLIAPDPFTVENNMMTPTLKIRRHVVRAEYGPQLDALYGK
ncbi:MAG: long-chain fatty acid--CoA ligase [Alphaproteobacteria bacterium]|nr:long-chain fatty acid--CoA ligase [Alphaproteobacteria bacterium]